MESLFSSTLFSKRILTSLFTVLLLFCSGVQAGGPRSPYWYELESTLGFDPSTPKRSDAGYLFSQFFPQQEHRYYGASEKAADAAMFQEEITAALLKNRPSIVYAPKGQDLDFSEDYCFSRKYAPLLEDTLEMMSSLMRKAKAEGVGLTEPLTPLYFNQLSKMIPGCHLLGNQWLLWPSAETLLKNMQSTPQYYLAASYALLLIYTEYGDVESAGSTIEQLYSQPLSDEQASIVQDYEDALLDPIVFEHWYPFTLNASIEKRTWGSCASSSIHSQLAFSLALIEDKSISDKDVKDLLKLRDNLTEACGKQNLLHGVLKELSQREETAYQRYILGAAHFYSEEYDQAYEVFADLAAQDVPWISETSAYMSARSKLWESQKEWMGRRRGSYPIDTQLVHEVITLFERYNADYPNGLYAYSAKGLQRRAYWLIGEDTIYQRMLREQKSTFLLKMGSNQFVPKEAWPEEDRKTAMDLFNEMSVHGEQSLNGDTIHAFRNFMGEKGEEQAGSSSLLTRAQTFVDAYDDFQNGNHSAVIDRYQQIEGLKSPELILIARAYEKLGEIIQAQDVWLSSEMIAGLGVTGERGASYEAAILFSENQGVSELIKETRLTDGQVKRVYLASLCDDTTQKELMNDADLEDDLRYYIFVDMALAYIYEEKFAELHELLSKSPDSLIREFSAIRTAVRQISEGESLVTAYMNIGFFLRSRIDKPIQNIGAPPAPDCRENTIARGARGPYYYFNKSITYAGDEKSLSEEKALYYLTTCVKYSSCMWGVIPEDGMSSKDAFMKIHHKYKDGEWAEKAKYYY